ncbi:hypothetical protein TMatcc_002379 [Talaromyces marneffei ATCC 18224]|uniref:uncharacterized protein n=1 Tax=Talaromyces marneffei TaxID=37727 RepID=UPI0012A7D465|nr:uncharacterized protein EYB26_006473 [Talaromyces marneffei]KAE8552341.1 hypothetical protein EYB25_006235 [Talaromyces marneffei]QGA18788.1 hypothetical protein EYB26_006473 [Talaromyces marneffei]
MTDKSSASRRQPKLRSSCDGCGMAKLRCDRTQPECGRCVSYGLPCVYGVSWRMGKAPGGGRRTSVTQGTSSRRPGATDTDKSDGNNRNSSNNDDGDAVMMDPGLLSSLTDIPPAFELMDGNTDDLINSYLQESSLLNLTSFDFDTKLVADDCSNDLMPHDFRTGLEYTHGSSELGEYSSTSASTTQPITIQTQAYNNSQPDTDLNIPTGMTGHTCYMDAYEILRSLSVLKVSNCHSATLSKTTKMGDANWVPFDHVLRINRETSERLSSLLACSCARSSHLTLLHASIICRVLTLYQQAAACTQGGGLSNHMTMTLDPLSHHQSPTRFSPDLVSVSLGTGYSTTLSGTTASINSTTSGTTRPTTSSLTQLSNLTVTPAKMAVGVFNVDDQRVQTAVNIQLVLGETRRTERLIDQFTTRDFDGAQRLEDDKTTFE